MFSDFEKLPLFRTIFLSFPFWDSNRVGRSQRQPLHAIHEHAVLADSAQRVILGTPANRKKLQQIPSLRCGMTDKRASNSDDKDQEAAFASLRVKSTIGVTND